MYRADHIRIPVKMKIEILIGTLRSTLTGFLSHKSVIYFVLLAVFFFLLKSVYFWTKYISLSIIISKGLKYVQITEFLLLNVKVSYMIRF